MTKNKNVCIVLCVTALFLWGYTPQQNPTNKHKPTIASEFPVPPSNDRSLFYIQRSPNTNTIVYELNLTDDAKIDSQHPVAISWINYATDGKWSELNYIQKTFAYGVDAQLVKGEKESYILTVVSYKKRQIYLVQDQAGKYHAYITINNKISILKHVFVRIEGGTFWVPNVKYVELFGEDAQTKLEVYEKIIP
jgi:hypothetical protein